VETFGQVVKVDVKQKPEYESTVILQKQQQQKISDNSDNKVMSSFKPSGSTKIYAASQDLNIYKTNDAINAINNNHSSSKIIQDAEQKITKINVTATSGNLNPYAQPGHVGIEPTIIATNNNAAATPAIPEPDYSMSDDSDDADNSVKLAKNSSQKMNVNNNVKIVANKSNHVTTMHQIVDKKDQQIAETSGSSTGSSSMHQSFSVDEIKKIHSQLKSSKTHPTFLSNSNSVVEEAIEDNSSSGVSRCVAHKIKISLSLKLKNFVL
jgi:SH3/ankyrin repeat-containing protein